MSTPRPGLLPGGLDRGGPPGALEVQGQEDTFTLSSAGRCSSLRTQTPRQPFETSPNASDSAFHPALLLVLIFFQSSLLSRVLSLPQLTAAAFQTAVLSARETLLGSFPPQ